MQTLLKVESGSVKRESFSLFAADVKVEESKISCLLGKSGSGKSTLLLAIAGFVPLESGKILYQGKDITHVAPERRELGLVFQKGALFPHLNVFQNVEFGLKMRKDDKSSREEKTMQWLKNLRIEGLAKKNPLEISGGEAQRVALARVFVMDYKVILLDEPFSSLDVELRKDLRSQLKELIEKYQRGALLVTHDPEDVEALGSITYRVENGIVEKK